SSFKSASVASRLHLQSERRRLSPLRLRVEQALVGVQDATRALPATQFAEKFHQGTPRPTELRLELAPVIRRLGTGCALRPAVAENACDGTAAAGVLTAQDSRHGASVAERRERSPSSTGHLHRPVAEASTLLWSSTSSSTSSSLYPNLEAPCLSLSAVKAAAARFDSYLANPDSLALPQLQAAADSKLRQPENLPGTSRANGGNWPDQSFDEMDSNLDCAAVHSQQLTKADPSNTVLHGVERPGCPAASRMPTGRVQSDDGHEQWIFLCAAHRTPMECSAIDYTRHTLDGAACLLNSSKYFPSRHIKEASIGKLASICRRVYRVFSHAYFHHRGVFDAFEEETTCADDSTVFVMKYQLMTKEILIVS
uniref:MOB kinase activator-like 4 n=1 Tax=Macrostomum lignano TaxID=282301 RepID=A0A1I8JP29_9PLAT